jgi:hypothetical protein
MALKFEDVKIFFFLSLVFNVFKKISLQMMVFEVLHRTQK